MQDTIIVQILPVQALVSCYKTVNLPNVKHKCIKFRTKFALYNENNHLLENSDLKERNWELSDVKYKQYSVYFIVLVLIGSKLINM